MNKTVMIAFSKNRALQCDLMLNSFKLQCQDHDKVDIKVIYKYDPLHFFSYEMLKHEHLDVEFIQEENFEDDLKNILEFNDYEFVLFSVDDTIYVKPFKIFEMAHLISHDKFNWILYPNSILGASLRLGKNTEYCYPLSSNQIVPRFIKVEENILGFCWIECSMGDFAYPLELSSSLYRVKDIFYLLSNIESKNPNELEAAMQPSLYHLYNEKPILLCFETSVAFSVPVNKVQDVAKDNRAGNKDLYTPDNLMYQFMAGLRIDPKKFDGMVSNAAHMEIDLL